LTPETAFELEVYAKINKYGSKKQILEDSLQMFFKKHKVPTNLREAAILLIEAEGES